MLELVAAGVDVVLDFSFWTRQMRHDFVLYFDHFEALTAAEDLFHGDPGGR